MGRLGARGRLLVSCSDQPGIVAAVTQFLFQRGANIVHSDQHTTDPVGGAFFMRVEFDVASADGLADDIGGQFAPVAERFGMDWRLEDAGRRKRLAIFVSREEHCLLELLWQQQAGDLPVDIAMVLSNHDSLRATVEARGIPYHHVPVPTGSKEAAEQQQTALLAGQADLIALARYMQIVSPAFVQRWPNRIINIHHSFLPAFVGARPYDQAYRRGVKLIGATAHYVTADLDAGPIIEQDVARVDHRHGVEELKRIGRAVERVVLARAVRWHVEDRILVHGNKTVVFA
ncbi:MAG TPA: formyltetrahydrofolate deformylase [Chloroflexota bacterium]|nr:formyltetrahydrofolate deformylase [Chloroflexota bacterium]